MNGLDSSAVSTRRKGSKSNGSNEDVAWAASLANKIRLTTTGNELKTTISVDRSVATPVLKKLSNESSSGTKSQITHSMSPESPAEKTAVAEIEKPRPKVPTERASASAGTTTPASLAMPADYHPPALTVVAKSSVGISNKSSASKMGKKGKKTMSKTIKLKKKSLKKLVKIIKEIESEQVSSDGGKTEGAELTKQPKVATKSRKGKGKAKTKGKGKGKLKVKRKAAKVKGGGDNEGPDGDPERGDDIGFVHRPFYLRKEFIIAVGVAMVVVFLALIIMVIVLVTNQKGEKGGTATTKTQ